jgi:endonuclease/exonuclease/phosphatase family metal-dependent hydrolase
MLTMMTWNIKDGGGTRLDAVLRVIDAYRPDLLALQELGHVHRGRSRLLARIGAATGMRGHLAPSLFGQAVAVLVRPPGAIVSTGRVRGPMHHAAARVTVATDAGPLTVVSAHLHPTSPRRRYREARRVAAHLDARTVLMGDLNALDRPVPLTVRQRRRHVTRGRVDTRAVGALAAAGLVDLYGLVGTGVPDTVPTGLGGEEFPVARIDYVMGTAAVATLARDCHPARDAGSASDHFPVVATIDLNFGRPI